MAIVERMQLSDGSIFDLEFIAPGKLLPKLVERSHKTRAVFSAAVRESMPTAASPWRLVVAFDEFSPGAQLKCDNTRLCW